jgi:hypothetical protein
MCKGIHTVGRKHLVRFKKNENHRAAAYGSGAGGSGAAVDGSGAGGSGAAFGSYAWTCAAS